MTLLLLLGPPYRRVPLVVDRMMLILRTGVGIMGSVVRILRGTMRRVHLWVVVSVLMVWDLLDGRELLRVGRLLVVMAAGALMTLVVLLGLLFLLKFIGSPSNKVLV